MTERINPDEFLGAISGKVQPEDFESQELPAELEGLTPQILFDLFDIAIKWGDPAGETGKTFWNFNPEKGYGAKVTASPYTKAMTIVRLSNLEEVSRTTEGIFAIGTKQSFVLWDRRFTVPEAVEIIKINDGLAEKHGYINPQTRERIYKSFPS